VLETGLQLEVRPENSEWKKYSMLSGGQKALITAAFALATSRCFPSSFLVLDELDAALDAINAHYLAKYLQENTPSIIRQVICVSHRVQVTSKAHVLIGVYTEDDSSCTCVHEPRM
jgi:chromosome segregation protein